MKLNKMVMKLIKLFKSILFKKSYLFKIIKYNNHYMPERNTPDYRSGFGIDFFQPMDKNDGDYIPVTTSTNLDIFDVAIFDTIDECYDFIYKHWNVSSKEILLDL